MMSNAQSSFAQKIGNTRNDLLFVVNGNNNNIDYWCILMVDKLKLDIFKRKLGGNICVQDFGKVLEWGYGKNPPQSIIDEFKTSAA